MPDVPSLASLRDGDHLVHDDAGGKGTEQW
jgi:hypothetical protein